jgi:hypothetical protein
LYHRRRQRRVEWDREASDVARWAARVRRPRIFSVLEWLVRV